MTIIRTAIVAASLVAVAATAHASQSREDLNSGYHGNTPGWSSPYGPSDAISEDARDAYGRYVAPSRAQNPNRAYRPVQPRRVR
jgi:hypothetical protein